MPEYENQNTATAMIGVLQTLNNKKEWLYENTDYRHEHLLIMFLILTSAYAYLETRAWPERTAVWPRMLSLYVLVGSTGLMFSRYFPDIIKPLFEETSTTESVSTVDDQNEDSSEIIMEENADADDSPTYTRGTIPDHTITALGIIGYGALGYLIGLFWATPIFIILYCTWFKISNMETVFLLLLGISVAYTFNSILNLPIMDGVLTELVMVMIHD